MTEAATETKFRVEGMDCASCATKIDTAVRRMPGVSNVKVSVTAATMTVSHDGSGDITAIARKVSGLGYKTEPVKDAVSTAPAGAPSKHDHAHGRDHGQDHSHCHDHEHSHGHGNDRAHDHSGNHDESGLHFHSHAVTGGHWWTSAKAVSAMLCGGALVLAYLLGKFAPATGSYAFIAAMLVGLIPIARRALAAALAGTPFSIEMLMTIAAVGAVIINAAEEAAVVVFLFIVGELLEGVAAGKARASIQSLTALVPKTALLEDNGKTREVPAESLTIGATVLVRPGDRIPADGVIVSGDSAIDESPVTGESVPVRKRADAKVFAGTVNGEAVLRVRVTSTASDNTIARVVKLVEEAQESKAPTERLMDRFSRYYTPGVVVVAALVAVVPPLFFGGEWSEWVYKGLAILLIGCPCALVISTPAAIAASLSAGARRGLLLKGGAVLEMIGKVQVVALDKTGTLTEGKPRVTDVIGVGRSETEVMGLAAAIETGSSHPFAMAILAKAAADGIDVPPAIGAKAVGGKGVTGKVNGIELFLGSAQAARELASLSAEQMVQISALNDEGKTVSVLLAANKVAGIFAMRDEPRPDAKAGLKALHDVGIRTVMLTGDNRRAASAIGKELGIESRAELLPEDKQRIVGEMKAQGLIVAKVGDGINDAPALAAADVGIAMGGGTDVALETADAATLHGRVGDIAAMIDLSKRTMANIRQNISMALGLKGLFLITTIAGITGLWPAILADTGATVLVTINALRLLAVKRQ